MELDKVYNIDCLEGLKQIDTESVDLVLTDPPYNENYKYRNSSFVDYREDYYAFLTDVFQECKRILKPTGSIYVKHSSRQIQTVPLSLHKKIEDRAKKEGRTRQNLILRILKERV
jgi:DNA modification methylase